MQASLSGADRKKAAQSAAKFREETSKKASLIGCTATYCAAQWTCKGKRPCRIIHSQGYAVCDPDHTPCRNLLPGRKFMPTVKNPLTAVSFPARSTHQGTSKKRGEAARQRHMQVWRCCFAIGHGGHVPGVSGLLNHLVHGRRRKQRSIARSFNARD
jgi:hypothetical protein